MTSPRDHSLSRLEIVVLARLSDTRPPSERALASAVRELALPDEPADRAREVAAETLAALRARGLVDARRRALTGDGGRALREALGLARTPSWTDVRDKHLPALALGLTPGSKQAREALRDADSIAAAVLRWQLGLHGGATLEAVCDALVAEVLRLPPGPLSLDRIRTHVLARRAGIEAKGDPVKLAARVAASAMGVRRADQRSMTQALGRRWIDEDFDPPPELPPAHPAGPPDDDVVLALVREAIPRIGAGGRYGTEKVFVSAIWDRIEGDRRAGGLSLDRFKRWLVTANREGWLVLARADLVSAMDRELVAASEIEDRGATFHFVLDRRDGGQEAGWDHHAP